MGLWCYTVQSIGGFMQRQGVYAAVWNRIGRGCCGNIAPRKMGCKHSAYICKKGGKNFFFVSIWYFMGEIFF